MGRKSHINQNSPFIRPLREAENEFLQVLITDFHLRTRGHGIELRLSFTPETPAIWLREGKKDLLKHLPDTRRSKYQIELDQILSQDDINYRHSDSTFPFRFGNGGTLPVVHIGKTDYYCLFYRDAHPAGWNIANGGANNVHDLLHPDAIVERELREELIVVEPHRKCRYVFDWHDARMMDHPDFAEANRLWMERFRRQGFGDFTAIPLPLKWLPDFENGNPTKGALCYDVVRVNYEDEAFYTSHGILNINPEDFGIEFDRIAKLAVGPDGVFCDGELVRGQLLNRVVGLFEAEKVNAALSAGEKAFLPDRLFWNGENLTGEDTQDVVAKYLHASGHCPNKIDFASFNLCPVTRTIIRRYLQMTKPAEPVSSLNDADHDIFISFASEDRELARRVYNRLGRDGNRRIFFSDATLNHGPFSAQVDQALESSRALVAVSTRPEHLHKSWVRYEWESFHNDILSGRKPMETPLVAFVAGVDIHDLPRPFRERTVVQAEKECIDAGLQQLAELIRL